MKIQRCNTNLAALALACVLIWSSGCGRWAVSREFESADKAVATKDYKSAVGAYERIMKRMPNGAEALEAARRGARVALFQIEDFALAINFYRFLIMYSPSSDERREAQRNVAGVYFDKLSDYKNAVTEYSRLMSLNLTDEDRNETRLQLAKAHYYLNNFFQSLIELDAILKNPIGEKQRFDVLFFRANVLLTDKKVQEALDLYLKLQQEFPTFAQQEKIGLSIAVCFEELGDYDKAISVLEQLKKDYPKPDFVDLKIKRLELRRSNQPGARGLRK